MTGSRLWSARCGAAILALTPLAGASERGPIEVGAALGYALPVGSLERGSNGSDVTFGVADLALDGAYQIHERWSLGVALHYGVLIPKLCASSADCWSSLGHDASLSALARWHLGDWDTFQPVIDFDLGYEWLGSRLVDEGVSSERKYRGFSSGVSAHGLFRLGRYVAIGPAWALRAGIFARTTLDAPGVRARGPTQGATLHAWTALGLRSVVSW